MRQYFKAIWGLQGLVNALIGGTPSSGSSLLSVLMNSHSSLCIGPELSLFSHPFFWMERGSQWRQGLLDGLATPIYSLEPNRWTLRRGFLPFSHLCDTDDLGWFGLTVLDLSDMISGCDDGLSFYRAFSKRVCQYRGKRYFCEKSPPNLYSSSRFLSETGDRVILTIRHPFDTIRSLLRRHLSFQSAISIWILDAAMIHALANRESVHVCRYEDLVTNPTLTLDNIFQFLAVDLEGACIVDQAKHHQVSLDRAVNPRETIQSWQHSPFGPIAANLIGKWTTDMDARIITLSTFFETIDSHELQLLDLDVGITLMDLASFFDYDISTEMLSAPKDSLYLMHVEKIKEAYEDCSRSLHKRCVAPQFLN